MQPKTIPADRALAWYRQAWTVFMRDPKSWIIMAALLLLGGFVLGILPVIGMIVMLVLMPALVAGLLLAAREAVEGREVKLEYLWRVLLDEKQRIPFLLLGAIMFGAVITIAVVSAAFIGDSLLRGATTGLPGFGIGGMLFMLVVGFASFIVFNYTPALMLFRGMSLVDALKTCVSVASTQVVPLLIFFLIYAVAASLGSIPFGLGLLVVVPVTAIAVYLSHKEIFA